MSEKRDVIAKALREAGGFADSEPLAAAFDRFLSAAGYAIVPREPSDREIGDGAHVLSGAIGARCCHVTGGYGPTAGREEARGGCDCRDLVIEIRRAMIAKAEEE